MSASALFLLSFQRICSNGQHGSNLLRLCTQPGAGSNHADRTSRKTLPRMRAFFGIILILTVLEISKGQNFPEPSTLQDCVDYVGLRRNDAWSNMSGVESTRFTACITYLVTQAETQVTIENGLETTNAYDQINARALGAITFTNVLLVLVNSALFGFTVVKK